MYHIIINPASRSGKGITLWNKKVEPALKRENVEYIPFCGKHYLENVTKIDLNKIKEDLK